MQLGFILYIQNVVGLQCFGIHVLSFYLEFTWMIFRCQDHLRTLTRGGNSSPPKSIWTHLRTQDDTLVVNIFSTTMSNWTHQIIHLPMFSMRVFRTLLLSQQHVPELGVHVHHHLQPRKKFQNKPKDSESFRAGTRRLTVCEPCQLEN